MYPFVGVFMSTVNCCFLPALMMEVFINFGLQLTFVFVFLLLWQLVSKLSDYCFLCAPKPN